ncbi:hypothetical protein [Sporosarcina sp. HYO08]|uniref:hypothetical protein n=1 Tax=Sporosarcina sp. HYO08 TaxID=1759557 RepID=UPI0007959ABC|nr:hypothetical protein [Sporosarcina sp. HYO08]KXH87275.1 hypothetical protein AU377_01495 [Sporosarcina sp. HYO08]
MYLHEPKLFDVVKRQFIYKMSANATPFTMLVILQIISLVLLSGSMGSPDPFYDHNNIAYTINAFSNDGILGLTWFWAAVFGFLLTSLAQRDEAFSFVTNRLSHHLANFFVMLSAALFGGLSAVLSGSIIKLYAFLRYGEVIMETTGLLTAPMDFILRLVTAVLYTLLFLVIAYTIGTFIQVNRFFIFLFGALWMLLIRSISSSHGESFTGKIFHFFAGETSTSLFILKMIMTVVVLCTISITISNRLEVRK